MSIQDWLGDKPKSEFVRDHYLRLPYSSAKTAREFCNLGSWAAINQILNAEEPDVMVVRQGEQFSGTPPTCAEQAQQLVADGYTVLVRNAQRHHSGLDELANAFHEDFNAPINVHIYMTPGKTYGFGWHYDVEEVFILQTSGCKEYSLRKNTVNPWPLLETMPADLQYEQEIMPLVQCTLSAGDWLYIPSGYWHKANAISEEPAISLAIGVIAPSAIAIFDFLRERLVESLLWRQRLPPTGKASPRSEIEWDAEFRQLIEMLQADLHHVFTGEELRHAIIDHFRSETRGENPR